MTEQPLTESHRLNIDGVVLYVRIDYREKHVSFMDERGNPCKFEFTKRGREYLGGWVKIYRALEKATIWADEKLAAELERQDSEAEQKIVNIFTALSDLEREK